MFRRSDPDEDSTQRPRSADRTWSSRIAWGVLVGGAALVLARLSVATVVQVRGDGMAPTILDGDHVLLLRGRWTLERGDVVVYDPTPPPPQVEPAPEGDAPDPDGAQEPTGFPDARRPVEGELRNTAVVEMDELEQNWRRVQSKSDGLAATVKRARAFRVGRILAMPGDTVTFNDPESPLGLSVDGRPVLQKAGDPIRVVLRGEPDPTRDPKEADRPHLRTTAFEAVDGRRYQVLVRADPGPVRWEGLDLPPPELGPVQTAARGYLVVADNRDAGACCDSRAIGWVIPTQIRGEVLARLGGDPEATPDLDPASRGVQWLP